MESLDFFKNYHDKLDLYIVSATPQEDLDEIIDRRNIRNDFKVFMVQDIPK